MDRKMRIGNPGVLDFGNGFLGMLKGSIEAPIGLQYEHVTRENKVCWGSFPFGIPGQRMGVRVTSVEPLTVEGVVRCMACHARGTIIDGQWRAL